MLSFIFEYTFNFFDIDIFLSLKTVVVCFFWHFTLLSCFAFVFFVLRSKVKVGFMIEILYLQFTIEKWTFAIL